MVAKGRPPLPDSERGKPRAIRLSDDDYAELQRRGMQALREWLRTRRQWLRISWLLPRLQQPHSLVALADYLVADGEPCNQLSSHCRLSAFRGSLRLAGIGGNCGHLSGTG